MGRVLACASVSGDPPYNHPRCPETVRASDSMTAEGWPGGGTGGFYGRDPIAKVTNWRNKSVGQGRPDLDHVWKQGVLGFVTDFTLERVPWSFRVEDISLGNRLTFWYGGDDYPPMILGSPWMQTLVPGSQLRVVPNGKHSFKKEARHLKAILLELRDAAVGEALRSPP